MGPRLDTQPLTDMPLDPSTRQALDALAELPCSLPRVDAAALSEEAFLTQYGSTPVVITGIVDAWPASARWPALFSAGAPDARYANCTLGTKSLEAMIARAKSPLTAHYRVLARDFDTDCPVLGEDIDAPRWAATPMRLLGDSWASLPCGARPAFPRSGSRDWRWLLLGSAAGGTPWHVDAYNTSAWNALVVGLKAWAIFPPWARPDGLRALDYRTMYGALTPLEWFGRVLPSLPRHERPLLCVQRPGELLAVPGGWWHAVLNLAPHAAVSYNRVPPHASWLEMPSTPSADSVP